MTTLVSAIRLLIPCCLPLVGWGSSIAESLALPIEVAHTYTLRKDTKVRDWLTWQPPLYFYTWVTKPTYLSERSGGVGTAWVIRHRGKQALVTAGHVIGFVGRPTLNGPVSSELHIVKRMTSAALGRLGGRPKQIGTLRTGVSLQFADVALILPDNEVIFEGLAVLHLADRYPHLREPVSAVGFPSSSTFAKVVNSEVVEVVRSGGFFVINDRLSGGYSGGAVIDRRGRVLGIVTGIEANQTTVLCLDSTMLDRFEFSDASRFMEQQY